MINISLCMIVKNESEVLKNCLNSVKDICDEIIIVDTGSKDNTKEIAQKFTSLIYDFKWIDDFSAARNFAFNQATKDYILWLDADDIILENDRQKLKELKKSLRANIDVVSMKYILQFDEYGNPSYYFRRNRLVKKSKQFKWKGMVHEYLEVSGEIYDADISIVHRKETKTRHSNFNKRNLNIYENQLKKGIKFTPRDLFYYANELKDHQQFEKSIHYYNEFLYHQEGWFEDKIRACLNLSAIYQNLNDDENELQSLINSFIYDVPRSETCCKIGDFFIKKKVISIAIYWYNQAIINKHPGYGFQLEAYTTWYPHLALCSAYWKIGDEKNSLRHHKITKTLIRNDPRVISNDQFFENNSN